MQLDWWNVSWVFIILLKFSKCQDPREISFNQITCAPLETPSAHSALIMDTPSLQTGLSLESSHPRAGEEEGQAERRRRSRVRL